MRTELLGQEKNIVKIKLDIEASEFKKALNKTLNELSQQLNIPGFRKGKAPRHILEMRFGREAIYNEALEKIIPDELHQIIEDYDLDPIETPTLDVKGKIQEGQPVECELIFEVRPEIELPEIEGLEIEKLITEVTDESVNDFAKSVRLQLAEIKQVERPVQDEDLIDVELSIRTINPDGTETPEQPKPDSTKEKIDLADTTIRKEVREALIGKSKGDEVFAVFDVEEKHSEKALAGKHVSYKMVIENVSEHVLPELNEEFFKNTFGEKTEIKDEESFKAKLRKDLERDTAQSNKNDLRGRAVELIVSKSKLELPENLVLRQISELRKEDESWAKNNNITLSDAYGLDTEEGRKGYENILRTRAEEGVRNVLVMDELAKKYDVHVEKEDLEAEFDRRAEQLGVSKAFLARYFYEDEKKLNDLTGQIRWDKIIDTVLSHMNVKEVKELSKPENNNNQEEKQGE